jgi:23S rRNA (uracil1939-C5)-methyltransferase
VRYDKQSTTVTLGFRSKQSSDIVSIHNCPILETSLNALIQPLQAMLQQLSMKKNIGHVELLQTKSQPWILLRVVGNVSQSDRDIVQHFCQSQGINGVFLKDNQEIEYLFEESLPSYESLNDISLSFQPNHFIQVNNDVNKKMIQQAIDWLDVKKSDVVLDLFCGVGNFSLPLAQHVKKVIGIEGVQVMVDQATANAQALGLTQAEFVQADLNVENLSKYAPEGVDKVLLDPSRQGAYEILKNVQHLMPTHIVYVSCDPVTLARDTSYLLEQGYQLNKVSMIDMFPQTRHIESMVLFKKISKRSS